MLECPLAQLQGLILIQLSSHSMASMQRLVARRQAVLAWKMRTKDQVWSYFRFMLFFAGYVFFVVWCPRVV